MKTYLILIKIISSGLYLFDFWNTNLGVLFIYFTIRWWIYVFLFIFFKYFFKNRYIKKSTHGLSHHLVSLSNNLAYSTHIFFSIYFGPLALLYTAMFIQKLNFYVYKKYLFVDFFESPYTPSLLTFENISIVYITVSFIYLLLLTILLICYKKYPEHFYTIIAKYYTGPALNFWVIYGHPGIVIYLYLYLLIMLIILFIAFVIFCHNIGFFGEAFIWLFGSPFTTSFLF